MLILAGILTYIFMALVVGLTLYESDPYRQLYFTSSHIKAGLLGAGWPIILMLGIAVACLLFFLKALLDGMEWFSKKAGSKSRRY